MINLEKFNEEANKLYTLLKCQFSVFLSTWKSLFKKLLSNKVYLIKIIYLKKIY